MTAAAGGGHCGQAFSCRLQPDSVTRINGSSVQVRIGYEYHGDCCDNGRMRKLAVGLGLALGACVVPPPDDGDPPPPDPNPDAGESSSAGCAPGVACVRLGNSLVWELAVRGSHVGVIDGRMRVYQGANLVAQTTELVHKAVGVPTGWLVASGSEPVTFSRLDTAGEVVSSQALEIHTSPEMVSGPGDRVLLAWMEVAGPAPRHVSFAIASPDGTIVVPEATAAPAPYTQVSVTTDGASFFVAADRSVVHITPEGVATVHDGFPLAGNDGFQLGAHVTSDGGPGGWYWGYGDAAAPKYAAQRFDASGAPVGAVLRPQIDNLLGVIADGDDLLLLTYAPNGQPDPEISLRRMTPDGTLGTPMAIGRGSSNFSMARMGASVVIGWIGDLQSTVDTYLATVTP